MPIKYPEEIKTNSINRTIERFNQEHFKEAHFKKPDPEELRTAPEVEMLIKDNAAKKKEVLNENNKSNL